MENSPLDIDRVTDSEKKESKSKKKKAEAIGAFVVEPKYEKSKPSKETFENSIEVESEPPLDQLAKPEKLFIEREFTKAEQEADTTSVEAVERFRDRIIIEGQDSDTALNETLAELESLPDAETETGTSETSQEEVAAETEAETPLESNDIPHEFGDEAILLNQPAEADTPVAGPTIPAAGGLGSSPPRGPIGSGPVIAGGAAGHGGAAPFGTPHHGAAGGGSPGFNAMPAAPTHTVEYVQGNTIGAALVGGIVGYLIGRRRGRIKTEKRLIPVQKKLQKEVTNLQSQLYQKEARIRSLAATKVQESIKSVAEKARAPTVAGYAERVVAETAERPMTIVRAPAQEANQLHGKQRAPEQIGHVLVGVESSRKVYGVLEGVPKQTVLERPAKLDKVERQQSPILSVEKNIDTLNRVDLLKLSEKIVIDGTSLRQIYETRLVGEKGLRRLVKEHLGSGDIKKALRREIVEREMDFERDPGLRDQRPQPAAPKGGGRAATLNDLLKNAKLAVGEDQEEVAFLKARSAYEEQERNQQRSHQHLIDVSFVGIIMILIGLVVILVIRN